CWGISGLDVLTLSFVEIDPNPTFGMPTLGRVSGIGITPCRRTASRRRPTFLVGRTRAPRRRPTISKTRFASALPVEWSDSTLCCSSQRRAARSTIHRPLARIMQAGMGRVGQNGINSGDNFLLISDCADTDAYPCVREWI